jgi:hypothetical protein
MARPCSCDRDACRLCWLYRHDERYRALWDNDSTATLVRRPLPCLHLGALLVRAQCLCSRLDVRHCDAGHGPVSQAAECEGCGDYEADFV